MTNKYKLSKYTHFFQLKEKLFLVFNTFSRVIIKMDGYNYNKLKKLIGFEFLKENIERELFENLLNGLIVVKKDLDELEKVLESFDKKRMKSDSFTLTIAPTMDCNFACPYCYEIQRPSYMSEEIQYKILNLVKTKISNIKKINLVWIGGEPLLAQKVVFSLTENVKLLAEKFNVKYDFSIVTNGYYLTKENVEKMLLLGINDVQVTIDGPEDIHNSRRFLKKGRGKTYRTIIENLKYCKDKFKNLTVRMNIDETNKDKWRELKNNLIDEGIWKYIKFNLGSVDAVNEHNIKNNKSCLTSDSFAEIKSTFMFDDIELDETKLMLPNMPVCTAVSNNSFSIDSEGYLYKCWNNIGMNHKAIGHIQDFNKLNDKYNKWMEYSIKGYKECENCSILPICMGNCPDKIMKFKPGDMVCSSYKKSLRETVLLFYLKKKKHS